MTEETPSPVDEPPVFPEHVYQPAEDSTLLLESAAAIVQPGWTVVESGVGSGFVAERLTERTDCAILGIDINPYACMATRGRGIDVVRGSLLDPIATGSIDAALFNPPYLPSDDRLPDDWLTSAVTGGPTGAEVVMAWLDDLDRVLKQDGVAIVVVSSLTGIDRVRTAAESNGFVAERERSDRHAFEELVALVLERG